MTEGTENKTPLITALLQLQTAGRFSWHMPGHRHAREWAQWLREELYLLDTTELARSDDLLAPIGPAKESLSRVSGLSRAGWSRYLTGGSTSGILAMLAAYPGRGGRILLSRTCHQSVLHAAAILNLEIGWIESTLWPSQNQEQILTLLPQTSLEDVRRAAAEFGRFDAIFLTSPDYYGNCSETSAIADFAHENGASLLVDEAHGAHFSSNHPALPSAAMSNGADICVQSLHKTLPALTSAAIIHVSAEAAAAKRIDPEQLENTLRIFHSSSPSFVIAATAEYALNWLHEDGFALIDNTISRIKSLEERFRGQLVFACCQKRIDAVDAAPERDPLRIVIGLADNSSIRAIANSLDSSGIDIEMFDLKRIVLIPALDQTKQEFDALESALDHALKVHGSRVDEDTVDELTELDKIWRRIMTSKPHIAVASGNILFSKRSQIMLPLSEAAGRIAARAIIPYPPGIPIVWPGEKIETDILAFIERLSENDVNLRGLVDKNIYVLEL